MNNEQLMETIKKIYGLIHPDTSPEVDFYLEDISDGKILDMIFEIVKPIVEGESK